MSEEFSPKPSLYSDDDTDSDEVSAPKPSLYSDDDTDSNDEKDLLQLHEEWYGDLWEDKKENTPRWRTHYERTGRMDIRFRAAPSLRVLVPDVATIERITKVNLTECPRLGAKRAREPSPTSGAPEAKGEPSEFLVIEEEEKRRKERARIEYRTKALQRLAAIRQKKRERAEAAKVREGGPERASKQ